MYCMHHMYQTFLNILIFVAASVFLIALVFVIFPLASLPTPASLFLVVAFGKDTNTPAKFTEVDLAIMVFVQQLHGFLNIICINFIL